MAEALRDLMLSRWQQVRDGLLATASKFSDAGLTFRAARRTYTVAETLLHIAPEEEIEVRYGIARAWSGLPPAYDLAHFDSVASIRDALAGVHNRTVEYV